MRKNLIICCLTGALAAAVAGCQAAKERYSPEGFKESFTHKNPNIRYQPGVLVVGASREDVVQVFGPPNGSDEHNGLYDDVYIFMPDGAKFVNPSPRARNVALAVVTAGTSVAVRQARLAYERTKLDIYRVYYDRNQKIEHVEEDKGSAFKSPTKP